MLRRVTGKVAEVSKDRSAFLSSVKQSKQTVLLLEGFNSEKIRHYFLQNFVKCPKAFSLEVFHLQQHCCKNLRYSKICGLFSGIVTGEVHAWK
jgi:hypothetical protein